MSIAGYIGLPYRRFNCWALVRLVLHDHFGGPLLPAHSDIVDTDKPAMSEAWCADVEPKLEEVADPRPGDVLACYDARYMKHVGICIEVDGRLRVLHTRARTGARHDSINAMRRAFDRLRWFRHA